VFDDDAAGAQRLAAGIERTFNDDEGAIDEEIGDDAFVGDGDA